MAMMMLTMQRRKTSRATVAGARAAAAVAATAALVEATAAERTATIPITNQVSVVRGFKCLLPKPGWRRLGVPAAAATGATKQNWL